MRHCTHLCRASTLFRIPRSRSVPLRIRILMVRKSLCGATACTAFRLRSTRSSSIGIATFLQRPTSPCHRPPMKIAAAKQLFALFASQAGSDMVREENGQYRVTFADQETTSQTIPGVAAAQFFTDFANPQSVYYTWNRTLPDDVSLFSASRLAMRIGFASDYAALRARNPNLNFDVAPIPQNASANVKRGYGTYYAFAVPRNAKNAAGSLFVAQTLAAAGAIEQMTSLLGMAPAHRSVLATLPADPVESVRYSAAIIARTWLDPKPAETNVVVREMFESIIAGRAQAGSAVTNAMQRIRNLF